MLVKPRTLLWITLIVIIILLMSSTSNMFLINRFRRWSLWDYQSHVYDISGGKGKGSVIIERVLSNSRHWRWGESFHEKRQDYVRFEINIFHVFMYDLISAWNTFLVQQEILNLGGDIKFHSPFHLFIFYLVMTFQTS
jgi:hypothetical protein